MFHPREVIPLGVYLINGKFMSMIELFPKLHENIYSGSIFINSRHISRNTFVPKVLWKWPHLVDVFSSDASFVRKRININLFNINYIDRATLFPNKEDAILSAADISRSDGEGILEIMDNSDVQRIRHDKRHIKSWHIKKLNPSPIIHYDERKKTLLFKILKDYPDCLLLYSKNPIEDQIKGSWDMTSGLWHIPADINLNQLYKWLSSGNWLLYPSRGIMIDKQDNLDKLNEIKNMSLLDELKTVFVLTSDKDNDWLITVDEERRENEVFG